MNKNEVGYWIRAKGHETFEQTAPERAIPPILESLNYSFLRNLPLPLSGPNGKTVTLTPDLYIREHQIAILVDGIHHQTARQDRKNDWRIGIYNENGIRVLIVDAGWTQNAEWLRLLKNAMAEELFALKTGKKTLAELR